MVVVLLLKAEIQLVGMTVVSENDRITTIASREKVHFLTGVTDDFFFFFLQFL